MTQTRTNFLRKSNLPSILVFFVTQQHELGQLILVAHTAQRRTNFAAQSNA